MFDPTDGSSHHLMGGSVAIWVELELGGTSELAERVARRVGADVEAIADEVQHVTRLLADAGLLERQG